MDNFFIIIRACVRENHFLRERKEKERAVEERREELESKEANFNFIITLFSLLSFFFLGKFTRQGRFEMVVVVIHWSLLCFSQPDEKNRCG